jgi:uncharacterized protein
MAQLFRVSIPVRDIDLATRFYSSLLGIAGERVAPGWHYFRYGQALLACHDATAEGGRPSGSHAEPLCLAVDEPLEQLLIRAGEIGAQQMDSTIQRLSTGEVALRMRDPFGNALWLIDSRTMFWGRGRAASQALPAAFEAPVLLFQRDFLNAVKGGELDRVQELLALDPELIDCTDAAGVSALMLAAYKRQEAVGAYLLATRSHLTVWEAAAYGRRTALMALLRQSPDQVNMPAIDGYLPLGLAAFFGHADCVEFLLMHGAEVNAVSRNAMHVRPLHSAVTQAPAERALPVVQLLLRAGAEVNVQKSGGYTPLHLAVNRDECELAETLLCFGADMLARAGDGRSAWDVARVRGHARMLALLQNYQAKRLANA